QVMVGRVGQVLPGDGEAVTRRGLVENRNRRVDDLGADAVAGDDRDLMLDHSNPVERPQAMQYAHPTSTSTPHAGQRSSPEGGCPQWGQKFTLRSPGSTPPQYAHCGPGRPSPSISKAVPET